MGCLKSCGKQSSLVGQRSEIRWNTTKIGSARIAVPSTKMLGASERFQVDRAYLLISSVFLLRDQALLSGGVNFEPVTSESFNISACQYLRNLCSVVKTMLKMLSNSRTVSTAGPLQFVGVVL